MAQNYKSLSNGLMDKIKADRQNHVENPYACRHEDAVRRHPGHDFLWRPAFVKDTERILHNNYYNRYSDKTQVLSCYKNDDISRRALHVQLVSRVARTIGMNLNLNLDLIEAISLGHDIGHTPFGHAGERFLNNLYHGHTGRFFNHNVHSVRVLDKLICRNISLQVLDGILCHNGEMEQQEYRPKLLSGFEEFDENISSCYTDTAANLKQIPSTLEGCVMRISDIIAYLGKDRQDAEKIGLAGSKSKFYAGNIGTSNAEIINNITVSIIEHSYGKPYLSMDKETFDTLVTAKKENSELIYRTKELNSLYDDNIKPMFAKIYDALLAQAKARDEHSILYRHHIDYLKNANRKSNFNIEAYLSSDPNDIVVDFIASMTDDYFIDLYRELFPHGKYKVEYISYFS